MRALIVGCMARQLGRRLHTQLALLRARLQLCGTQLNRYATRTIVMTRNAVLVFVASIALLASASHATLGVQDDATNDLLRRPLFDR